MDIALLYDFLVEIERNNNRPWFLAHKDTYDTLQRQFLDFVQRLINNVAQFDTTVTHVHPKDAVYRFYRDVRFSADKSPYKRHFGTYINAYGKKSIMGGYYLHLQPGQSFTSVGCYYLPSKVLSECREEIDMNQEAWREIIHKPQFVKTFGRPKRPDEVDGDFFPKGENGFGLSVVKTTPKGFDKDHPLIDSLRLKDYCAWHAIDFTPDTKEDELIEHALRVFRSGKELLDFINPVIADALTPIS